MMCQTLVRLRKRHLPFVVAAGIGAFLIGAPAESQTPAPNVVAAGDANTFTPANVTIATGGTVEFTYPGPAVPAQRPHNVNFTSMQPTRCELTAGPTPGPGTPMPKTAVPPPWAGTCTFAAAGTYAFVCDAHRNMTGSVTVVDPAAVPTPPVAPPPPPPPPEPPPPPPAPVPPPAAPAASALRLAKVQRAVAIRGSVRVRSAGSRLLARAFARRKALFGGQSTRQVQVGRQARASVGAGRVAFTVQLSAAARRALRRNGRLAISLRLTVTPPSGAAYTATRAVTLRVR
jgi:plastocyanin